MKVIQTAIALSDLHLGMAVGYLHTKSPSYHKNRNALLDILQRLGPQDEIILNGDILDMSLASHDQIHDDLTSFFELLADAPRYERLVYIPGNHDHHFWRSLAESMCIDGRIRQGARLPNHEEYPDCFVDKHFSTSQAQLPAPIILGDLWPRGIKAAPEIVVKYPHHLIEIAGGEGLGRYCLFSHGHFLEGKFRPVNSLIDPGRLAELEGFNNMWLEFFDYDLGHAGRFSVKVRQIESQYTRGDRAARDVIKKTLDEVFPNLRKIVRIPKIFGAPLKCLILTLLRRKRPAAGQDPLRGTTINDNLKAEIVRYLGRYVLDRYRADKASELNLRSAKDIPTPFTFVFGHTHRPVRDHERAEAEVKIDGKPFPLANTGGWLRTDGEDESPKPAVPNGRYAGVLVVNSSGIHWEPLEGKLE